MKKRIFNYRPLCLIFLFLLLGTVFSFYIVGNMLATIIVSIVILLFVIVIAILKKKVKYFLIPLVAFVIGVGLYFVAIYSFESVEYEKPNTIIARIYNVSDIEDGSMRVYADSCKFDGEEVDFKITIYIYDYTNMFHDIDIGSVISFTPYNFYKSDLFYSEVPNSYLFSKNIKYTISVLAKDITYIDTDITFAEQIKENIKENLTNGLTNENADIAYSSLFGETYVLSESQNLNFQLAGVSHLLAVSGMHIVIIVAILNKFFDLVRIKKWYRLVAMTIILFLYLYMCNFTISALRATIMAIVLLFAPLVRREYDALSSIGFAGIICMLVNPLSAFDAGFLMSFACVVGIAILFKPIKSALMSMKMPKWLAESIGMSVATNVSLIFIMAFFFENVNLISILANIILIPIFTFAFIIVFVLSFVSLVLPFITYVLYPLNYVFDFINVVANVMGGLPISNFTTISIEYYTTLIYMVIILLISRSCVADRATKVIMSLPLVALLVVCMV